MQSFETLPRGHCKSVNRREISMVQPRPLVNERLGCWLGQAQANGLAGKEQPHACLRGRKGVVFVAWALSVSA